MVSAEHAIKGSKRIWLRYRLEAFQERDEAGVVVQGVEFGFDFEPGHLGGVLGNRQGGRGKGEGDE
jgi:hypothetical protein